MNLKLPLILKCFQNPNVFQVVLSSPSTGTILSEPSRVDVIINANDNPAGVLSLRSPDFISLPVEQINEDTDSDVIFSVIRTAGSFGTVSVNWEIIRNDSGVGSVNLDVSPNTGTVSFEPDEREKPIIITVTQDDLPEPAERFKLRLLPSTVTGNAKVEGIIEGLIVIEDSDNVYGNVEFAPSDLQTLEVVSRVIWLKFSLYPLVWAAHVD